MIISRTPLRITLGGGGTDLPSYYERFGGSLISAAINKYIFVSANRTFSPGYTLKYSQTEHVSEIDEIQHDIFREVLRRYRVDPAIELVSLADIPTGTGLGSSGTFTVGLLRAIHAIRHEHVTAAILAEEACDIEINVLGRAVGKQDQYIAAFGGLTCMEFNTDGTVDVRPLRLDRDTLYDLEEHLLMFFTRYSRDAEGVLQDQKQRSESDDAAMLENLHVVKSIGNESRDALERGDTGAFAELMRTHWEHKKSRSQGMSNSQINEWYDAGMESGAIGGKLVGAGGGGFLLFYTRDPRALRIAMREHGLEELRFSFDQDGSTVLVRT
jgi:D-glycero-alpha-D-manno-heptose-7-phosphate kinase